MALFPHERQIVIAGGGYAGLHAAAVLAERLRPAVDVRVTFLSKHEYFLDRCRLHEAAVRDVAVRYLLEPVFENTSVEIVVGELSRVDTASKTIRVEMPSHELDLPFDDLFLATGAKTADYGIPGVREHAAVLEGYDDAVKIRAEVSHARANAAPFHVTVVGGGLTGIELAGELAEYFGETARSGAPSCNVTLLEAAGRLLPLGDEQSAAYCERVLRKLGAAVRTSTRVSAVKKDSIEITGAPPIPSDLTIWCAGIQAQIPEGLESARRASMGRIATEEALEAQAASHLLLGGDITACTPLGASGPLAPKAMWAVAMGEYAGMLLAARIRGEAPPPPPSYIDKGELISLGRREACGQVLAGASRRFVGGFPAVLLKQASLTYHLWGITGRTGVPPLPY